MSTNRQSADAAYARSDAILDRLGDAPTHDEKAAYWHALGRDTVASVKSTTAQMVIAIARGAWAWSKADRADSKIADLERRLVALERRLESEKRGFHYRGIYTEGELYDENDFATHAGSLWACLADGTTTRPGESDAWQLCCKRGRDGRDRR